MGPIIWGSSLNLAPVLGSLGALGFRGLGVSGFWGLGAWSLCAGFFLEFTG